MKFKERTLVKERKRKGLEKLNEWKTPNLSGIYIQLDINVISYKNFKVINAFLIEFISGREVYIFNQKLNFLPSGFT